MDTVLFFAYGTLIDKDVISSIIGRTNGLAGEEACLNNYSLVIQTLEQVPDVEIDGPSVTLRKVLQKKWGDSFRSYAVIHKPGGRVNGMMWRINQQEYSKICTWEMVDVKWYEDSNGIAQGHSGSLYHVKLTVLGEGQKYETEVDGLNYQPFLGTKEQFLEIISNSRAL